MNENKLFAVIADKRDIVVTGIKTPHELVSLTSDEIEELVYMLASHNDAWNGVLYGERIAVIFDSENGNRISINNSARDFCVEGTPNVTTRYIVM